MIDNICKFLAENFSADFASWLLGESITLTKLEPSELSVEPIRADSVIFLESAEIILHLEFQTEPNESPRRKRTGYLNSFLPNILTPQSGGVFTLFVQ